MYVHVYQILYALYLQLPQKLNEFDSEGNIPLNLALLGRHEGMANTLVSHNCDLDVLDPSGNSLLHLAIMRGDSFSASFLIKNGANTILARKENQETPLHLVASYKPSQVWCKGLIQCSCHFFKVHVLVYSPPQSGSTEPAKCDMYTYQLYIIISVL